MNVTSSVDAPARPCSPRQRARFGALLALLPVCVTGAVQLWTATLDPPVGPGAAQLLLDPNTATRSELMLLPSIGPQLSARIVAYRREAAAPPAFSTAGDLANVRGIGPATVAAVRPFLRFGPQVPGARSGAP